MGISAENQHQTRRYKRGSVKESRRGSVGEKGPDPRVGFVGVQALAQDLSRLALGNNSAVNVNAPGQLVPSGRMSVTALDRIPPGGHNMPLSGPEIVLLHRIQVPQSGRMAEYDYHSVGLLVADVGDQGSGVSGRLQRSAQEVAYVARFGFDSDVLPGLGVYVVGPEFGSRPPVA